MPAAVLEAAPARPQLDQHAARQWEVRAHACTWGPQPPPSAATCSNLQRWIWQGVR